VQSDPNTRHVTKALEAMECIVVQDMFLNETAKYAHVFLPGSSFLERDGTFTNAERRISRIRTVMPPRAGKADWEVTMALSNALGYPMNYRNPSEIMDEIAALTPTFAGVSYAKLDELGSIQWPCNDASPNGTPVMHVDEFVRGKGKFFITRYVPTDEKVTRRFPLLLTTGRANAAYRKCALAQRRPSGNPPARCRRARHCRRRLGRYRIPRGTDRAARENQRTHAAGRGLHDLSLSRVRGQRHHHG
jgi:formate dehydrogenase major subunit